MEKQSAIVSDPIMHHAKERPLAGELGIRGDGTYLVSWRVSDISTREYKVTASYTPVLAPKTSQINIYGRFWAALVQSRGTGSCRDLESSQIGRIIGS